MKKSQWLTLYIIHARFSTSFKTIIFSIWLDENPRGFQAAQIIYVTLAFIKSNQRTNDKNF